MPPIDSFIANLLAMRSHYQTQINQCDRTIANAQEGLIHVNALLVDETLDNQQFATNLLQMRSYYQATLEDQKGLLSRAKEQLVHINALLAEQIAMQDRDGQTISMQASTINNNLALTEVVEPKELPVAEQSEDIPTLQGKVQAIEENQESSLDLEQISPADIPSEDQLEAGEQNQPQSSVVDELPIPEIEAPQANRGNKTQLLKTPLLPQYQHLTRSEAVEKLLQENIGTILHTDYIVRSLYGNLEPEAFKVEKQRLYETLGKGIAKGLWDKVPDQPGCYTVDIKLVDREVKPDQPASSQQAKVANEHTATGITPKSNGILKLLPAYQHLNYTQAVATVLQENAGQEMDSEKVARILYGDLEGKNLSKAKDKVGKILWTGARQKRWQSVVGKLGAYTMVLEKVPNHLRS
ncbi:hypothetical protein [Aliterella atlantica]|uniref:Uncharacterized protein n=1 Tax=Aliterella atlantica CENA595 TaxID=1618023 RepID=A0A0D8ZQW4_9CYAN|nr:hypothetical protein [Aliterella atlantica]KJH69616.1 hypothetical protein UH38_22550 [Aliterella atlantica CENA595]